MKNIKKFYSTIFRTYKDSVKFIEYRQINDGKVSRGYFDLSNDMKDFIEFTKDKNNMYFGVCPRSTDNKKDKNPVPGSYTLWLDFDLPKPYPNKEMTEALKAEILERVEEDPILGDFFAVVDTGHGLHVYYNIDKFMSVAIVKANIKRLFDYCLSTKPFDKLIDVRCGDIKRILRCPGSINSKEKDNNYQCKIVRLKNKVFKGLANLNKVEKECRGNGANKYSTAKAFKALGIDTPPANQNISCILPKHNDNKPSFRYYDDTDTWFCFSCNKGGNGLALLKAMERPDLIQDYAGEVQDEAGETEYYRLTTNGKLYKLEKKNFALQIDLGTNKIIKAYDKVNSKYRIFLYYENLNRVIEITDFPSAKKLRGEVLSVTNFNVSIPKENNLNEILSVFMERAVQVNKLIIFNNGINNLDKDYFFMNARTYPEDLDYIFLGDIVPAKIKVNKEAEDINEFLESLIKDGNYTHVVSFLWGVASTVRDIIIRRFELFPMLIATGISNSGKSKLASIIRAMFISQSESLGVTDFVFIKNAKKYGTIPVHFEEYTEKQLINKDDLLKRICTENRAILYRGTHRQNVIEYPIQHPMIITGEHNIYSKGILSRAIVLNVSNNMKQHDNKSYNKWIKFCADGRAFAWLNMFLESHWRNFRTYFEKVDITTKNREDVKVEIILNTFDFLLSEGLIAKGLINKTNLRQVFSRSKSYTDVVSTNSYLDMLTGVSSYIDFDDLENNNYNNNSVIKHLYDNTFFNLNEKYVAVCPYKYLHLYKELNGDRYLTQQKYEAAIMQSPDFMFLRDNVTSSINAEYNGEHIRYRKRKVMVLRVSDMNKEIFFNILCHKLHRSCGVADMADCMEKADLILDSMIDYGDSEVSRDLSGLFL